MTNSSDNMYEAPSAEWCENDATTGDAALCEPPAWGTGSFSEAAATAAAAGRDSPVVPAPPRPYPAMGPCNSSAAAPIVVGRAFAGTLCTTEAADDHACLNAQRGGPNVIFDPRYP